MLYNNIINVNVNIFHNVILFYYERENTYSIMTMRFINNIDNILHELSCMTHYLETPKYVYTMVRRKNINVLAINASYDFLWLKLMKLP